jgi:hypothetical protein
MRRGGNDQKVQRLVARRPRTMDPALALERHEATLNEGLGWHSSGVRVARKQIPEQREAHRK